MTSLRIVRIEKPKEGFSKKQREFNTLAKEIEDLGIILKDLRQATASFRERYIKELQPLHDAYFQSYQSLIILLDQSFSSNLFDEKEKAKIGGLIANYSQYLMRQTDLAEIRAIWEKYHRYAAAEPVRGRRLEEQNQEMSDQEYVAPTGSSDTNYSHDWSMDQKLRDRAKMEQGLTKAAVRKIYLTLVKEYHPDREADEELRKAKTILMQEITLSFAQNDLHKLLELQLQLESGSLQQTGQLNSKALNHYIKGFKNQIQQLNQEILGQKETLALICQIEVVHTHNLKAVGIQFQTNLKQAKTEIKNLRSFIKAVQNPIVLRDYLTTL